MRLAALIPWLVILTLSPTGASAQEACGFGRYPSKLLAAGHDESGWYVRSNAPDEALAAGQLGRIPRSISTTGVGDLLAHAAGATAFYFGDGLTEDELAIREWRGESPLEALRSLAVSAGLVVETPAADAWLIGPPWMSESQSLTIRWRPLDARRGPVPGKEGEALARALVAKLPVRTAKGTSRGVSWIEVETYWLPEEGRDVVLVVATWNPPAPNDPSTRQVFKVRVDLSKATPGIECIWATKYGSVAPQGPFYSDLSEDFDGDGYRDFGFGREGDSTERVVLSGRDGSMLFSFPFSSLAVEKENGPGPKRVSFVRIGGREEPSVVTMYDLDAARSARNAEARAGTQGKPTDDITEGSGDEMKKIWRRLAKDVGGAGHVRLYTFDDMSGRTITDVEVVEVKTRNLGDGPSGTSEASKVLFAWESEGFQNS